MNSDDFGSLDPPYAVRSKKEPGYVCFPLGVDNILDPHDMSASSDHNADSSASLSQSVCGPMMSFEKIQSYFQPHAEGLAYRGHQCSPAFSDFSSNSKTDALLNNVVRTRRRKAGISEEERICIVCGEPASGYNFDRLTCESCKAFFRRNALKPKDKIKACNRGGGCIIEGNQRKHCPSCRLEKCFAVGMKRELILPPEKLEQRAKPRRRKPNSPHGDNCSPVASTPTTPMSTSSINRHPSCLTSFSVGSQSHHLHPGAPQNTSLSSAARQTFYPTHRSILNPIDSNPSDCHSWVNPFVRSDANDNGVSKPEPLSHSPDRSSARLVPCRHTNGRTVCRHQRCKRSRWRLSKNANTTQYDSVNHSVPSVLNEPQPDSRLLGCLRDCVQRIREPFTPDEKLDTGVAVTLEQEYNRMDACIRRIIRVAKLLPYFNDTGKQAQLGLLRTNIYGLIILYSSFFYERNIRKLRYPILQFNGERSFVTISMLNEVVTPSASGAPFSKEDVHLESVDDNFSDNFFSSGSSCRTEHRHPSELREEFELYKANTLAAFDHLDQLVGPDDIVRVTLLAIKLFTDDSISLDDLHASVEHARQTYLLFLWSYLRWRAGPKQLRSATEMYARLLISFIDLRTLETRMTDFAKLLSLDGLSPLMREVCSQRPIMGTTKA